MRQTNTIRSKLLRPALAALGVAACVWLVAVAALSSQQEKLLFPAPRLSEAEAQALLGRTPGLSRLDLGAGVNGWLLRAPGPRPEGALCGGEGQARLVMHFGGNFHQPSSFFANAARFPGCDIAVVDFPGYGLTAGPPSEEGIRGAAERLSAKLRELGYKPGQTIITSMSMGTGLASRAAAEGQGAAAVLVEPYTTMVDAARFNYPLIPGSIVRHRFDSISDARRAAIPALITWAGEDEVIGKDQAMRMAEAWKGPAFAFGLAGARHNDWDSREDFWSRLDAYLRSLRFPGDGPAQYRR